MNIEGHQIMPERVDPLNALAVAVYVTDNDGRITYFNEAAATLWGRRPDLFRERWCGASRLFYSDGRPMAPEECPMAVTVREGKPLRHMEAVVERPDGTRIKVRSYPSPLRGEDGAIVGAINVVVDLSSAQSDNEIAHLANIVDSSQDAIVSGTLEGNVVTWNKGAARLFGYEAEEMFGRPISTIIPDELLGEEHDIVAKVSSGERVEHYETVRVRKDGSKVDISLTVSPLRDKHGTIIGASKIARDISERKRAEALQRLLTGELNHRVKNTLAIVQAIAEQTLRYSKTPAEFSTSFIGRIQALSRAHKLLTDNDLEGGGLHEIVRDQILLGGATDSRISYSGPVIHLSPQAAINLVLVIHELGTNARKHGALTHPYGKLAIKWSISDAEPRMFVMDWRETNGPPPSLPVVRGFGTKLIERSLKSYGGTVSLDYGADGLICRIALPLKGITQQSAEFDHMEKTSGYTPQGDDRSALSEKKVLVVEDETLISMLIEESLQEAGCTVVGPAGTVELANDLLAGGAELDAALLDANLNGTGVEVLAIELDRRGVPFVFVTGYGREMLPEGFRDRAIVSKPFTQSQLVSALNALLS